MQSSETISHIESKQKITIWHKFLSASVFLLMILTSCTPQSTEAVTQYAILSYSCNLLTQLCEISAQDSNQVGLQGIEFVAYTDDRSITSTVTDIDGHAVLTATDGSEIAVVGGWVCTPLAETYTQDHVTDLITHQGRILDCVK